MNECILARFFPKPQQSQIIKETEAETGLGGFRKFLVNRGVLGAIIWLLRSPEQGLRKSMEGRGRSMATQPVLASCEGGSHSPPRGCTLGYPLSFPSCLASTPPPPPTLPLAPAQDPPGWEHCLCNWTKVESLHLEQRFCDVHMCKSHWEYCQKQMISGSRVGPGTLHF